MDEIINPTKGIRMNKMYSEQPTPEEVLQHPNFMGPEPDHPPPERVRRKPHSESQEQETPS
jgi:hypothetical protein